MSKEIALAEKKTSYKIYLYAKDEFGHNVTSNIETTTVKTRVTAGGLVSNTYKKTSGSSYLRNLIPMENLEITNMSLSYWIHGSDHKYHHWVQVEMRRDGNPF